MARVALFVDGANMFYAQREQRWHIDWRSVYQHFTAGKEIYGAFYFTATPPAGERQAVEKYRRFRTALIRMGYNVIDKEVHIVRDSVTNEVIRVKGNLDIELVFRMLTTVSGWDEGLLFGLDIDYVPIIEHLSNLGKTVVCVGRKQMTSLEVINVANKFIDLEDLRNLIQRRP